MSHDVLITGGTVVDETGERVADVLVRATPLVFTGVAVMQLVERGLLQLLPRRFGMMALCGLAACHHVGKIMQACSVVLTQTARIDHHDFRAARTLVSEDALIQHRVAPRRIGADQHDQIGLVEMRRDRQPYGDAVPTNVRGACWKLFCLFVSLPHSLRKTSGQNHPVRLCAVVILAGGDIAAGAVEVNVLGARQRALPHAAG